MQDKGDEKLRKINQERIISSLCHRCQKQLDFLQAFCGWTSYFLWTVNWGLELRTAFRTQLPGGGGGALIRSRCDKFGQAVTLAQRCRENVNTGQSIKAAKWVCAGSLREHLMSWCEFALGPEQTGRPAAAAARQRAAGLFPGLKYLQSSTAGQSEACYPEWREPCGVLCILQPFFK